MRINLQWKSRLIEIETGRYGRYTHTETCQSFVTDIYAHCAYLASEHERAPRASRQLLRVMELYHCRVKSCSLGLLILLNCLH